MTDIDPDYPAGAPPGGGQLVLRLLINEHGRTDGVQVLEAEPRGAFEKAAIHAFSTAQYRPGEKNGQPVKSQMTIAVTFHPERQGHLPGESAR